MVVAQHIEVDRMVIAQARTRGGRQVRDFLNASLQLLHLDWVLWRDALRLVRIFNSMENFIKNFPYLGKLKFGRENGMRLVSCFAAQLPSVFILSQRGGDAGIDSFVVL